METNGKQNNAADNTAIKDEEKEITDKAAVVTDTAMEDVAGGIMKINKDLKPPKFLRS